MGSGGFKKVPLVRGESVVNDIRSSGCLHSRRFTDTVMAPQQRCIKTLAYCSPVDSEEDLIARGSSNLQARLGRF